MINTKIIDIDAFSYQIKIMIKYNLKIVLTIFHRNNNFNYLFLYNKLYIFN